MIIEIEVFSENKMRTVIFKSLNTRVPYKEVIECMTTSSFISALKRLFTIRGPIKPLWLDRGTNFISACKEINISAGDKEEQGCT